MRIGASLPLNKPDGGGLTAAEIKAIAKCIEQAGFAGIWVPDQVGRGATRPDPLMWLLLAAEATTTVELGTAVLQIPLRYPVELAQRLLSLHMVTGGRFRLGAGAGSTKADFDAVGVDYSQRFALLSNNLKVIRRICRGERVGDADLKPWSTAIGGPPIYIGAWASGIWVPRAARLYDGWMASGGRSTLADLKNGIVRYRDEGGQRALVATVAVDLSQPNARLTDEMPFTLRCGPESAVERIQMAAELGFDDVLLRTDNFNEEQLLALSDLLGLKR